MFDWIVNVVRSLGYPGVALLTFLEDVVPPIPSELVMPLAGFIAVRDGFTAGFAGVPFLPFLYSLVGTAAWTAALTYAGVLLGRNYDVVQDYLSPATGVVIGGGIMAWCLYTVITYDPAGDAEMAA